MLIAACADSHIGPQGSKLAPTGLNARLADHLAALEYVCADARSRGAEALLIAGDLFSTARPSPTDLILTATALARFGGPVIAIAGNHDAARASAEYSGIAPLADRALTEVRAPSVVAVGDCTVACVPYPNRSMPAAILRDYESLSQAEADARMSAYMEDIFRGLGAEVGSGPSVLLAHLALDVAEAGGERQMPAGRDIMVPLSSIPEQFAFAVLGHIHKPQDFAAHGRPNVLYCGSTDRMDFGEEGQEKSYVLLDTQSATWERVPIPCRAFVTVTVDYTAPDSPQIDGPDPTGSICRIRVRRPEDVQVDRTVLRQCVEGCFDFRGWIEDVQRVAPVRCGAVLQAQSLPDLLQIWHEATGCAVPLEQLKDAAAALEAS